MTNSTSNAPDTQPENIDKNNSKKLNITIDDLMAQATEDYFRLGSGSRFRVDPRKLDSIDMQKLPGKIQGLAISRSKADKRYEHISQNEINDYDSSEIKYLIYQKTATLKNARVLFQQRVKQYFPHIDRHLGSGYETFIDRRIAKFHEDQLSEMYTSRVKTQGFLEKEFFLQKGILRFSFDEFDRLFPHLDARDSLLSKKLQQIVHKNQTPDPELVKQIFALYDNEYSVQKNIAEYFHLDFSLREIVGLSLLDDGQIEKCIQEYVGMPLWNQLGSKEREKIIAELRLNDTFRVSYSKIKHFGDNPGFHIAIRDALPEVFDRVFDRGDRGSSDILGDLNPKIINQVIQWHEPWLVKIDELAQARGVRINGLKKLQKGAVLVFPDPKDPKKIHTLEITGENISKGIEDGVTYRIISNGENSVSTGEGFEEFMDYESFGNVLLSSSGAKVYSANEFQGILTGNTKDVTKTGNLLSEELSGKIFDTTLHLTLTKERLIEELDLLDVAGKSSGFQEGTTFVSHAGESGFEEVEVSYTVQKVDDKFIQFTNGRDIEVASLDTFLDHARNQGFRRVGLIKTDKDFIKALGSFGVDTDHVHLDNGNLKIDNHHKDDHNEGHADHGHGHHKKPEKYEFFEVGSGGHIRVLNVGGGKVIFGEYNGKVDIDDARKVAAAGKLTDSKKNTLYNTKKVSYGMFLKYLVDNKCKATTEDLLGDQDAHYHAHDPHMESDIFKRWLKKPSLADIFHGIHGITHAVEHYFEKGSKLTASRSALWIASKLHLPADVMAGLSSEEINNIKTIIDQLVGKLQGLNGPIARKKALHIVHSKGSRPEEIMAAALYMVKGYGHLYAEDIKYAQGSESFINALISACGYPDSAIKAQKIKAREKFRTDIGTEPGGQITEEEMIWGFLKGMDGNAEENRLAGALVKAMGGPSGWERAWRDEGHKGAIEKGKRQTNDIPNARGRLGKYFSAIATHEFNTAYGMMVNIASKSPSPGLQGAPIVWCLSGMTQYASTKLAQEGLWQFVASQGHTMHAYSFLRNKPANDLYRDVFLQAMDGIASQEDIIKLKDCINQVQYLGKDHDDRSAKKQLKAFQTMNNIWEKYQSKGLHDRLQGKDNWLIEQIHSHHNDQAAEYLKHIGGGNGTGTHAMMSTEQVGSNDSGWFYQFGHTDSPLMHMTDDKLMSYAWQINKIPKDGSTNFALKKDNFERMWPPIMGAFDKLRNNYSIDPELKKKQYFQFRKDVVEHFRQLFNSFGRGQATEEVLRSMRAQPYSKDLARMGISLEQIFTETYSINDGIAESDFLAWKDGGRGHVIISHSQQAQDDTRRRLQQVSTMSIPQSRGGGGI